MGKRVLRKKWLEEPVARGYFGGFIRVRVIPTIQRQLKIRCAMMRRTKITPDRSWMSVSWRTGRITFPVLTDRRTMGNLVIPVTAQRAPEMRRPTSIRYFATLFSIIILSGVSLLVPGQFTNHEISRDLNPL
jgi:hypothetical protein